MAIPHPRGESNLKVAEDREGILSAVELELAACRAQRTSSDHGTRTVVRLLGLLLLLGLLAAGLAAMWYLQTVTLPQRAAGHQSSVTSPAP